MSLKHDTRIPRRDLENIRNLIWTTDWSLELRPEPSLANWRMIREVNLDPRARDLAEKLIPVVCDRRIEPFERRLLNVRPRI